MEIKYFFLIIFLIIFISISSVVNGNNEMGKITIKSRVKHNKSMSQMLTPAKDPSFVKRRVKTIKKVQTQKMSQPVSLKQTNTLKTNSINKTNIIKKTNLKQNNNTNNKRLKLQFHDNVPAQVKRDYIQMVNKPYIKRITNQRYSVKNQNGKINWDNNFDDKIYKRPVVKEPVRNLKSGSMKVPIRNFKNNLLTNNSKSLHVIKSNINQSNIGKPIKFRQSGPVTEKQFDKKFEKAVQKYETDKNITTRNIWKYPKDVKKQNFKEYVETLSVGGRYNYDNNIYIQPIFGKYVAKDHELGHFIDYKTDAFKNVSPEFDKKMQNVPKVKKYLKYNKQSKISEKFKRQESRAENFDIMSEDPSKYVKKYPEIAQIYLDELGLEKPVFKENIKYV